MPAILLYVIPLAAVPPVLFKLQVIDAAFGVTVPELFEQPVRLSAAGVTPATVVNPSTRSVLPPGPDAVHVQVDGYPTHAEGATLGAAVPLTGLTDAEPAKPVPSAVHVKETDVAFFVDQVVV